MSTYAEQLAEAQRELGLRRRVYPKLLAQEAITDAQAASRIALMEDIVATLTRLAQQESGQQALFGEVR